MENIYETNDSFKFDKLNLLKPVSVSGGNYFIRFTVDGNYLYVQPPKCKTKQGIVKAGKKYYTDLMFSNANDQFIRWMENLETYCHQFIHKNREQWFEGEMEMHDIENYFTSPMKIFKSGTFYIVRTNIPSGLGKPTLKIYDEHENEVSMESINEDTDLMTIIEIQGIKCSAKSFQIELEIKQLMVFKSVNMFERCIIKSSDPKKTTEQGVHSFILNEASAPKKLEEEEEADATEPSPQQVDEYVVKNLPEQPLHQEEPHRDLEIVNESYKGVADTKEHLEQQVEEMVPKNNDDDIEEIDFGLEQLSSEDTIQIKRRNDVYYEMYREARKKAKIAKDLALSSYLEAKRIKNTYMLNDIVDSDSSDLEELDTEDVEED
jgi:hypothetical protein